MAMAKIPKRAGDRNRKPPPEADRFIALAGDACAGAGARPHRWRVEVDLSARERDGSHSRAMWNGCGLRGSLRMNPNSFNSAPGGDVVEWR